MTINDLVAERFCRGCGGRLDTVLHLGDLLPSGFPAPEDPLPARVPLDFCACADCQLVQLRHTVHPDAMFRQYWYRSSINEAMRAELADIVDQAVARVGKFDGSHDLVVDVGANDGTLLSNYRRHDRNVVRIAFEPATNLQSALMGHAEVTVSDYFPHALGQVGGVGGRVKILTSIACFYDLDDPGAFIEGVAGCLHPDGVWIVQFQDLAGMLRSTAFDNICFEHLCYYSLGSVERLIAPYGMKVLDAEVRAINAGSLRLTIGYGTHKEASPRVDLLRASEAGCDSWEPLEHFAWRVGEVRRQIQEAVGTLRETGGVIDLYGASTKANTLLQYCGLGPVAIRQAWERSPEKWGRTTITGIPIVSEETGRGEPPQVLLGGIWQFREALLQREAEYLERGGTILFPLPQVELVSEQAAVRSW